MRRTCTLQTETLAGQISWRNIVVYNYVYIIPSIAKFPWFNFPRERGNINRNYYVDWTISDNTNCVLKLSRDVTRTLKFLQVVTVLVPDEIS